MESPAEFLGIVTFLQPFAARLEVGNAQSVLSCRWLLNEYKWANSRLTWSEAASDQVWADCHFS